MAGVNCGAGGTTAAVMEVMREKVVKTRARMLDCMIAEGLGVNGLV